MNEEYVQPPLPGGDFQVFDNDQEAQAAAKQTSKTTDLSAMIVDQAYIGLKSALLYLNMVTIEEYDLKRKLAAGYKSFGNQTKFEDAKHKAADLERARIQAEGDVKIAEIECQRVSKLMDFFQLDLLFRQRLAEQSDMMEEFNAPPPNPDILIAKK